MMILLLGNSNDSLIEDVGDIFNSNQIDYLSLDIPTLLSKYQLKTLISNETITASWSFANGDQELSLSDINGVLIRTNSSSVTNLPHTIVHDASDTIAALLTDLSFVENSVNPPQHHLLNGYFPSFAAQVTLAMQHGIKTPDILMTNNLEEVQKFYAAHDGNVIARECLSSYKDCSTSPYKTVEQNCRHSKKYFFLIEKISREPVFIHICDQEYWTAKGVGQNQTPIEIPDDVMLNILNLHNSLNLRFSETCAYIRDTEYVFYYISYFPKGATMHLNRTPIAASIANKLITV